jgi:hypothetical protein
VISPHGDQVMGVPSTASAWGRRLHMLGTFASARPQQSPGEGPSAASLADGVGTWEQPSALYQGRSEIVHNPHGYYPKIEFFKPHHRAEPPTHPAALSALEERTTW